MDPDKAFLLSFLPEFKKMNDNQKLDFKIVFMQSVKNILNPPIDTRRILTQTFTNSIIIQSILVNKLLSLIPAIHNSIYLCTPLQGTRFHKTIVHQPHLQTTARKMYLG